MVLVCTMGPEVIILATLGFFGQLLSTNAQEKCGHYKVNIEQNIHSKKRLLNHGILNVTVSHPFQCFSKCTEHCLCESFNICDKGKRCELSSSTKDKSIPDYLDDTECKYYEMERELSTQFNCQTTGTAALNEHCCRYNNPCLNDGECFGFCPNSEKRFECRCKGGFHGDYCQHKATTCQDYWNEPKPANGVYDLFMETGMLYKAFCDFHSEEGIAWTLVMSRDREYVMPSLLNNFVEINAITAGDNVVWSEYTLARSTMGNISVVSTDWRLTCNYNTHVIDYVDYVRGKVADTDLMSYSSPELDKADRCRLVVYGNIRGKSCNDCTIGFNQGGLIFHSTVNLGANYGCDLDLSEFTSECSIEYYFGGLHTRSNGCRTENHRCAVTADSTSQIWFGGKLKQ